MTIQKQGYGAGSRDLAGHPNVLRLTLGESQMEVAGKILSETISVLEANLDDLNPQVFGYVVDRLLAEGALDTFALPVQMKKNRPGMLLTVLAKPEDASRLIKIIFMRDQHAGRAATRRTAAGAGAEVGYGRNPLGRRAIEDRQHERHGDQLRA